MRIYILSVIVFSTSVMVTYRNYKKVAEEEALKRKIIYANLQCEMLASKIATEEVIKKIRAGEYNSVGEAFNDLEFKQIVILG